MPGADGVTGTAKALTAPAAAIGVVVAINSAIGVGTERQSDRIIRSLAVGAPESTRVLRDGRAVDIPLEEVVPGDLLLLAPGVYVAADGRLIQGNHLSVDESALTGESLPVDKSPAARPPLNAPLADRGNMVFRGTVVAGGNGPGLGEAERVVQVDLVVVGVDSASGGQQRVALLRPVGEITVIVVAQEPAADIHILTGSIV